jgi:hypothetical protein
MYLYINLRKNYITFHLVCLNSTQAFYFLNEHSPSPLLIVGEIAHMSPQISLVIPTLPPGLCNGDHCLLQIRGVCICHFSKLQGGECNFSYI